MNKRIICIAVIFAMLTISSCKKFLEITPQETFTSTIATSSIDGLSKTVVGAFSQLQSGNLYGGGIIANSEMLGDFVSCDPIADYSLNQLRTRQMDANNAQGGGLWSDAYRAIYICNVVLQALPNFQAQNPTQCQLLKGECLFIRGAMHFELLRMFAQPSGFTSDDSHLGVCIQLLPGAVNQGQDVPRSTVAQCYAQIEADLDSAYTLLPAAAGGNIFASSGAAAAFMTRVYFTQHNYQQALNWSNIVIGNYGYALNDSVTTIYNAVGVTGITPETIFQDVSNIASQSYANGTLIGRFRWLPVAPATCYMSKNFNPYYQADSASGGSRWKDLYRHSSDGVGGPKYYWCQKYTNSSANVTVVRLAEMLLTRAECNAQLGNSASTVLGDVNLVRVRAGLLPDNTTSGQQALLNLVRAERDYELAAEGDRLYEIKRRQINFYSPESGQLFTWNSPQLIYAIPLQELLENKNMVQNPGY